ncbi:hypothetical protein U1Q18_052484 [Sarracenia purpurea var. burkii]
MKVLQNRYEEGCAWSSLAIKNTLKKLEKLKEKARHCEILFAGDDEFKVNEGTTRFDVLIDKRTCSCGVWEISGLHSKHAIAALLHKRLNIENYSHIFYQ